MSVDESRQCSCMGGVHLSIQGIAEFREALKLFNTDELFFILDAVIVELHRKVQDEHTK